jgi:DNA-binding transcriptional MerR regulator
MFKARKPRATAAASAVRTDKAQIEEKTYSSMEVASVAQVSLRQLQWWDERKVVSPRHEGHRRVYYAVEVIEITVIAELRRKGFSLQKIRRVLRFLQKEMGKRLAEVLAANSDLHLVTDGKSIFLEDQHDRIIDILKNARQPMFLVSVSDQARRLTETERKPARMEPGLPRRAARVG